MNYCLAPKLALGLILASTLSSPALAALPTGRFEKEAVSLAKILKPIPDDQWKEIAGERVSERYQVQQDDTLWDISRRLFGDPRYWPKIFALNNSSITNPHVIRPGSLIAFLPGTGTSLPGVAINSEDSPEVPAPVPPEGSAGDDRSLSLTSASGRSNEWQRLPKQKWEAYQFPLPPEVDPLGFDRRSKISFHATKDFELPFAVSSDRVTPLGTIVGSKSPGTYLSMHDQVFIRAEGQLEIGRTYALTREPSVLASKAPDPNSPEGTTKTGYSYMILGKVQIIDSREGFFIGTILTNTDFLPRNTHVVPLPPRARELAPVPGASPIQGEMLLDHTFSTFTTAPLKQVFIDLGSEDGVREGMVFRAYHHDDPSTEKKLTDSNFIVNADMIVVQVARRFSSAIIISGQDTLTEHTPVTLLTDVSDVKSGGIQSAPESQTAFPEQTPSGESLPAPPVPEAAPPEEVPPAEEAPPAEAVAPPLPTDEPATDELDEISADEQLKPEEERELQQLERWKGDEGGTPPPEEAPPETAPSPDNDAPPPLPPPPPPEEES